MQHENFNIGLHKPVVLVAPLDWGLGHATRCIPIIRELIEQGCTVLIAAKAATKNLLQSEFPSLHFIELEGYRVQYSRHKFFMPVKLLLQLPRILYRVYAENRWLKKTIIQYGIDAVISDNRLGLYHKKIPCVYITHQLRIKTGNSFTETIAQKIHYHYINKFCCCWVPDEIGNHNLSGALSHRVVLPRVPLTFIGLLSRFQKITAADKYDLTVILSGPEPQRTILENRILSQIEKIPGKICVVRGLPGQATLPLSNSSAFEIRNHLPANELNLLMQQSTMIISRCGYSTVMDLAALQKKAILVPTPGQTEQEYLSEYLQEKKLCCCINQEDFDLARALQTAENFEYHDWNVETDKYKLVIKKFTATLPVNNAGI